MIIAITGASGFLGRKLLEKLSKDDTKNILAFSAQVESLQDVFNGNQIKIFTRDDLLHMSLKNVDFLINCAFPRNNDGRQIGKGLCYINNILNHAVNCKVKNIINISSQSVYSQRKNIEADENTDISLESLYAVGKFASELLTNSICKNVRHTNIRLASLIGPEFEQRLINKMIDNAIKTHEIAIVQGSQAFGFMDIDDAVSAIISMINSQTEYWDEIYNLGIIGGYSLLEIAMSIKDNCQKYGITVSINQLNKMNTINSTINCNKFYKKFNFKPIYKIDDSIEKILVSKLDNLRS